MISLIALAGRRYCNHCRNVMVIMQLVRMISIVQLELEVEDGANEEGVVGIS